LKRRRIKGNTEGKGNIEEKAQGNIEEKSARKYRRKKASKAGNGPKNVV